MLMDLSPAAQRQASLFDPAGEEARQSAETMVVLDSINARYGRDTLTIAAAGMAKRWITRADNRTPWYTTQWSEVPRALAS